MKKKFFIIIISLVFILASIIYYFFSKNNYKTIEFGNNSIKSAEDIKEYILNISSYEAEISVEVKSNKNTNKYKIKQSYSSSKQFKQEILEPNNIEGLITIYDGKSLKITNTKLGLEKIYENYEYLLENSLCLNDFIDEYKNSNNAKLIEEDNDIIMQIKSEKNSSKYNVYKKLYVSKEKAKPIKMEIYDTNQKMLVYILYNEIKMNSINKDEVLAFKL